MKIIKGNIPCIFFVKLFFFVLFSLIFVGFFAIISISNGSYSIMLKKHFIILLLCLCFSKVILQVSIQLIYRFVFLFYFFILLLLFIVFFLDIFLWVQRDG